MTREEALQAVRYDKHTGHFYRARSSARTRVGDPVGTPNHDGYLVAKIGLARYLLHRVAWLIENGSWPNGEIDHINGNRADNRIENLRVVSRSQNVMNSRVKNTNKLGIKGVRQMPNGKYQARISKGGVCHHLGTFEGFDEAIKAWEIAAEKIHGIYKVMQQESYMAYETKNMAGSLFKNNRKERDTHPDYTGSVRIDNHDFWMSGWLRETKDGTKYFSLAFKAKDGTDARPSQEQKVQEFKDEAKRVFDLDGDSVPF